jgi:hypothetical protein
VHEHVVMSAEENAIGEVGSAAIAHPFVDVMRFGVARV